MRKNRSFLACAAIAAASLAFAPAARAQQSAYAIAGGSTLINFNTASPAAATAVGTFNVAGTAVFLDAIDYRPFDGQLYGYSDATDTVYLVNAFTAELTPVVTATPGPGQTNTNILGMDFNPTTGSGTASLFRIVTESTQNLVYNVVAPAQPTVATPLFYPAGDAATIANPNGGVNVIENAYTNNLPGALTTQQYGIDYVTNSLVTIANNAGTLGTVGGALNNLGIDVNVYVGFDIFTSFAGTNIAYAVLDTSSGLAEGTTPGLYTIDLDTGAATSVGALGGGFVNVYSLAVAPAVTAVPEAGTAGLLALGGLPLAAAGVAARRRRQRQRRAA